MDLKNYFGCDHTPISMYSKLQFLMNLLTGYLDIPQIRIEPSANVDGTDLTYEISHNAVTLLRINPLQFTVLSEDNALNLLFSVSFICGSSYAMYKDVSCKFDYREDHCCLFNMDCNSCRLYYESAFAHALANYILHNTFGTLPSKASTPLAYIEDTKYDQADYEKIIDERIFLEDTKHYVFELTKSVLKDFF